MSDGIFTLAAVVLGLFVLCGGVGAGMYGCPKYNVWQQGLAGEAELSKAEFSKQVAVQEANAKKESAKSLAEAEVIRAEGVAKANKIIGDSLQGNDAYLRYLWIQGLNDGSGEVVYIPTEANLPLLEARPREKPPAAREAAR